MAEQNKQPTEARIKEFWEWCGLERKQGLDIRAGWYSPDGRFLGRDTPLLDLNNLSRYAIPKLMAEYHNWKSVLHDWVDGLTGDYEKDTLSLFWLIREHCTSNGGK